MELRPSQAAGMATKAQVARASAGVHTEAASRPAPTTPAPKSTGYGLPCANCRLYYPADLEVCPSCHSNERVSATAALFAPAKSPTITDPIPDSSALEHEREEFLRQFKSQLLATHQEVVGGAIETCTLAEHHAGEPERAEICRPCYERLQERLDVCEASLHIDLKEAAQIVYDAVWADPSDPGKTYQNAANALLSELRKRAGLNAVLGPFQPLPD
jgi:hypothetical protein